jgi:predicted translation initiation factor SUI1
MARKTTFSSLSDLHALLPDPPPPARNTPTERPWHDGKGKALRVHLDSKGRKGKVVTVISGLQHNPQTLEDLSGALKRHCGAGGTVKEGTIELQGDQRSRAAGFLRDLNYRVSGIP